MTGVAAPAPTTLLDYLRLTTDFLAARGIDGARLDAELLLASVLGLTRTQLYTSFDRPLLREEVDRYRELVRRRAAREPAAYILGRREFWTLDLEVDRRVLVPRPETELLVEKALDLLRASGRSAPGIADIGTGSGAIALALAREVQDARVVATDLSEAALELARRNAVRLGVDDRLEWRAGDGCAALPGGEAFDVVVSNPPYVKAAEMAALEPEVREWEPKRALVSGADGMDVTRPLVDEAFDRLAPGGWLLVEVGTQAAEVRACFERRGYESVTVWRDLAGLERVVAGRRPGADGAATRAGAPGAVAGTDASGTDGAAKTAVDAGSVEGADAAGNGQVEAKDRP